MGSLYDMRCRYRGVSLWGWLCDDETMEELSVAMIADPGFHWQFWVNPDGQRRQELQQDYHLDELL